MLMLNQVRACSWTGGNVRFRQFVFKGFLWFSHHVELSELRRSYRNSSFSLICHQFCAHSVRTFSITEGARNDDGVWCERVSIHCWVAQDGFVYDSLSNVIGKCPNTTQPSILDLFVSAAILQCFDHFHKVPLDVSFTMNMPSLKQF